MFVYLLVAADSTRFKIGWAVDIHKRIPKIGGVDQFDLEKSRCILQTTKAGALAIENALHRLFAQWRCSPNARRQTGDTEFFRIDCFERVMRFLLDNPDLTGPEGPVGLPPAPIAAIAHDRSAPPLAPIEKSAPRKQDKASTIAWREARAADYHAECLEAIATNTVAARSVADLVSTLHREHQGIDFGRWAFGPRSEMILFVHIQNAASRPELVRDFAAKVEHGRFHMQLPPSTYLSIASCHAFNGIFLLDLRLLDLRQWRAFNRALAIEREIGILLEQVCSAIDGLPPIDHASILRMLERAGLVDARPLHVEALKRLRSAVIRRAEKFMQPVEYAGSVHFWLAEYYRQRLIAAGSRDVGLARHTRTRDQRLKHASKAAVSA